MDQAIRTLTYESVEGIINGKMLKAFSITALAIAIKNIFEIDINQYVITFMAAAIMPFLNYSQLLCYSASIIPIAEGMNGGILWVILALLFNKKSSSSPTSIKIYVLSILIIELANLFLNNGTIDFKLYFFYSSYIILFFYITFLNINDKQAKSILLMYLLGLSVLCIIIVCRILFTMSIDEFLATHSRIGYAETEFNNDIGYLNVNPNSLGYYSIVGITIFFTTASHLKLPLLLKILLLTSFIIAGALTISRSWIIILTFCLVWILLRNITNIKYWFVLLVATFAIIQFDILPHNIIDSFTERFNTESLETAGGRSTIFEEYNDYLSSHPERIPFGVGTLITNEVVRASHSPHNGTQQVIVGCGVVGFLVFFAAACKFYTKYIRGRSIPLIMFMPFVAASLFLQTIQFLMPFSLILPLAMTTIVFKIRPRKVINS